MGVLSVLHETEDWLKGTAHTAGAVTEDVVCSKTSTALFGAVAFTGCGVIRGIAHAASPDSVHQESENGPPSSSSHAAPHDSAANHIQMMTSSKHRGLSDGFLDTSLKGVQIRSSSEVDPEEERIIERAEDAIASSNAADTDVRTAVETAEEAVAEGLTAAQVCLWTELVASIGAFAGIMTSWIGWKMDDSHLPEQLRVPEVGDKYPVAMMVPPPGTRVAGRLSSTADRVRMSLRTGGNGGASSSSGPGPPA